MHAPSAGHGGDHAPGRRSDKGLGNERQLLVEEQKLCRARARKFSLETNRRRRALEERRKQWDVQEQRLRENVLQQRRQRVQDATERFQRAHLPPSQRRRQCQHFETWILKSFFLLLFPLLYINYYHLSSMFQDSHVSDCCNSESLSSKDSLDGEDHNHVIKSLESSCSSLLFDTDKSHSDLRKQNDPYPLSDHTSFPAMMLLGDTLPQPRKLHELKQKKQEDSEGLNNRTRVPRASWDFTSIEKTPKTETQPPLQNATLFTLCEILSADTGQSEINSKQNSPSDNFIVSNRIPLGNTVLESSCTKQEAVLDLRQQRVHNERQSKHPSATELLLPAKNGKDSFFGAPTKPNILNDSMTDNVSQEGARQQAGKDKPCLSSQKESSTSINNLNKISDSELKTEKPLNTELPQRSCLSNIQSNTPKCLQCSEEEVQKSPVSHRVCEVRLIKGILKKQSKYMSGDNACVYGAGHLIFAKQVALAIRDSVELTRAKSKELEGNSAVKKKLRWFDEVHVEKEDREQSVIKQMKGRSSDQSKNSSEDHQPSLSPVSGAVRPGPGVTRAAPTGYHFTKQAWADVGVQVSLPPERADEVKAPQSYTRTGGPQVPPRERCVKAETGPVSSRTRKGTNIRPQSASEVSQIAKTQGKVVVPRPPPPRTDSAEEQTAFVTKAPYGTDPAGVNYKQPPAAELHKENPESCFPPHTYHEIRTDSHVLYTPLTPSYTCPVSDGNTKSKPRSSHQETQSCNRRRGMALNEKGPCLNCTPTDEEISQLWHGVRSALATKDGNVYFGCSSYSLGLVCALWRDM
uniref:Centrosomal protein 126 n=1 Tax=Sphaeramia orbicularis TaxID=375764 RepID=A0A673AT04_9TELE